MGVPAFFRWLTKKYPSIVVNANEERQRNVDGTKIPIDASQPNPNFQVRIRHSIFQLYIYLGI